MPRPSPLCTSKRVPETVKSPLPSSPSTSPSSPSSAPSSPSSAFSTSPGRMGTGYREEEDGACAGNNRVRKTGGDGVSSTSSSLAPSLLSAPPTASLHHLSSSPHLYDNGQREDMDTEIYDPFQPTEGEGMPGVVAGDEGDKYDPFEPTGSPASEKEMNDDQDGEEESSIGSIRIACDIKDTKEVELETTPEAEGPPPDSTETGERLLVSEHTPTQVNRIKHTRQRGKDRREEDDSEHSEIEEGEIVGVAESRREREIEIRREVLLPSSGSPSFLQGGGLKPERILRVLDGEGFVSIRAEGDWDKQPVPPIGMGDLRRKLTNRRKQRFRSCPSSASISPPPASVLPIPSLSPPASQPQATEKVRSRRSSKSSKERDRRKMKGQEKEKRKKRKEEKGESERASRENKEREHERRSRREGKDKDRRRSSRSYSQTRKTTHRSSPEPSSHSHNASRHTHSRRSWSSPLEGHHRGRDRNRDRDRERDRYRDRRRDNRERDKDSRMREGRKRDQEERSKRSDSRERGDAKRRRESSNRRDGEKERGRERERDRRRDGRPVVPPSIQDLNGSDLFAIKRTITVTTTPTNTLITTSPSHTQDRAQSPTQDSDKPRKRKRKRRRRSDDEEHRSRSHPTSLSPVRYHGYESDRLSDHPEPDMLSLDGEALDSDYPSLEDSPLLPPPPEPPLPSPKLKSPALKSSRHHQKKKSRSRSKKLGQSESSTSSSSHRPKASKSKSLLPSLSSPLSASSGNTAPLSLAASSSSAKRIRKTGKDKPSKKESSRSGRSKKLGGSSRKGKLQSKVSVLVREGVSSTTGNSGKLGIDLLGPSGTTGPSVVGGSIAVVFRRDNESRSPFLKPCSEPLSLPGRVKDLNKTGKQRNTLSSLSSTNPTGLKSKKAKPSSTTSTSSSASSPTSSSAAKRRRRPGKKSREKGLVVDGPNTKGANSSTLGSGWTDAADIQPLGGIGPKPSSPPSTHPGPTPSSASSSSSSSSSTSILPPSSSPPHTPPLSLPPSRDTRESSPDSQTVDSSCKTPEPSFLSEECPVQSQSTLLVPAKSPPSPPPSRGDGISQSVSKLLPLDDQKTSPPCSTSSALAAASLAHSIPPLAAEPSSSSSASVSSSTVSKPPPPPPPPSAVPPLPWSLQTGVDCTAGGVLACEFYPPSRFILQSSQIVSLLLFPTHNSSYLNQVYWRKAISQSTTQESVRSSPDPKI